MAEAKTKRTMASVRAFLDAIEDEQKRKDAKAIAKLMAEESGEKAYMLGDSIVGFGAYKIASGEWPLVGFSPRKANFVLYIESSFAGRDGLLARLGKHKTGKVCVYVNRLSDIDTAVLRTLVSKAVARMREKYECV